MTIINGSDEKRIMIKTNDEDNVELTIRSADGIESRIIIPRKNVKELTHALLLSYTPRGCTPAEMAGIEYAAMPVRFFPALHTGKEIRTWYEK